MPANGPCWEDVIAFLDTHSGKHAYGAVAEEIGSIPRAIGQMMKAICRRNKHHYCKRVIDAKTGKPRYQCPGKSK